MHDKEKIFLNIDFDNSERADRLVEITTGYHLSIQKQFAVIANINTEYKQDMAHLFLEIFQNYKNESNGCRGISLEKLGYYRRLYNESLW